MDKLNLLKMARDSGVALIRQEDGSYLLSSTTKLFADRIESAVAHKYEQKIKNIVQVINDHWHMTDDDDATKGHILNSILHNIQELREVKNGSN